EQQGFEVTYLPVNQDGLINLNQLEQSIRDDTILISVMMVNNETGVIHPISDIAKIASGRGIVFMTDATQAIGKMPVDVNGLGVDLLCLSGHKFHGPLGVGALYIRKNKMSLLQPLLHGGGHEKGLRSGTLNAPGIIGLGKAAEIALNEVSNDKIRIEQFRNDLESKLLNGPNRFLNGGQNNRLHNVSNICFKGVEADVIIAGLKKVIVSNGSACTSTVVEPSHVLTAMGLSDGDAYSSIRFSLSRFTTQKEIDYAVDEVENILRRISNINQKVS
ncbi:MAG: cysteine desulfurase, partial [Desulfovibrionales bacterium]|nr:cysteine desulfurase [Desulfovibrionales bacterium]